jgi:integrase
MASVRKRIWKYNGQTKTAFVVAYTDLSGKRRLKTFRLKKQADEYRMKVEREIEHGDHVAASASLTVAAICAEFIRTQEDRLADGRIGRGRLANLVKCINISVLPHLGARKMQHLRSVDIENWYRSLCRDGGLSPTTAKDRVFTLRLVEAFAQRRGYLKKSPISEALKELRGTRPPTIRIFTRDEIAALLRSTEVRGHGRHERTFELLRCAVHLAAFCGLRWGEIMGLTRAAVDLDGRLIKVRHSLTDWDELKSPKTPAGVRDVPMPCHLRDMLRDWLARFYVENPRDLVFCTSSGGRVSAANFHAEFWRPLLARAGLIRDGNNLHFHALRHFAASWMLENGLPLMDVASLLGHKKFDVTLQVYAHPIIGGSRRSEAIDRMAAELLRPLSPKVDEYDPSRTSGSSQDMQDIPRRHETPDGATRQARDFAPQALDSDRFEDQAMVPFQPENTPKNQ